MVDTDQILDKMLFNNDVNWEVFKFLNKFNKINEFTKYYVNNVKEMTR